MALMAIQLCERIKYHSVTKTIKGQFRVPRRERQQRRERPKSPTFRGPPLDTKALATSYVFGASGSESSTITVPLE